MLQLRYTGLSICIAANMLVKGNGPKRKLMLDKWGVAKEKFMYFGTNLLR